MKKILCLLLCIAILPLGFIFTGCGKDYSYEELQTSYNNMINDYKGTLFDDSGDLYINYSSSLLNMINNGTQSNQMAKFSKDLTNGQAIFEPVLRAGFESVSCFVNDVDTQVKFENIPQNIMNSLYNKFMTLKNKLEDLKKYKVFIEGVGNVENWIGNYRDKFYDTICANNDFALSFINAYTNYANEREGLFAKTMQLDYVTKLIQNADIYTKMTLSQIKNSEVTTGQSDYNKILASYLQIEGIFMDVDFIILSEKDENNKVQEIVTMYGIIDNFNGLYNLKLQTCLNLIGKYDITVLFKDSSENNFTLAQQGAREQINDFVNVDNVAMCQYLIRLKDKIVNWKNA